MLCFAIGFPYGDTHVSIWALPKTELVIRAVGYLEGIISPRSRSDGGDAIPMRSERLSANPTRLAPNLARLWPWKDQQSTWQDHRRAGARSARVCRVR